MFCKITEIRLVKGSMTCSKKFNITLAFYFEFREIVLLPSRSGFDYKTADVFILCYPETWTKEDRSNRKLKTFQNS